MEEKDLQWQIEVQTAYMRRIANRIKAAGSITALDMLDLAVSCEILKDELKKHGVEV